MTHGLVQARANINRMDRFFIVVFCVAVGADGKKAFPLLGCVTCPQPQPQCILMAVVSVNQLQVVANERKNTYISICYVFKNVCDKSYQLFYATCVANLLMLELFEL